MTLPKEHKITFQPSGRTVYVMPGFDGYGDQLERLGPHKTGKSCLYLKNLDAVDRGVLEEIISDSVLHMRNKYKCS